MQARAARLARRDATDATDLARAADALNDALLVTLDDGTSWDFLETEGTFAVTSATDLYTYTTISATLAEVYSLVNDTSGDWLRPLSWEALEHVSLSTAYNSTLGTPFYWAKWGSRVRIWPQPDAAYTLSWFGRLAVTVMSAGTDVPVMPLSYRYRILVPLAAAQLLRMESGFASDYEASNYEAQAAQATQQMRIAHGAAKRPAMGVMEPSYGRDWPAADAESWLG